MFSSGEDKDWMNYYIMIIINRDMYMCYTGGGIGHSADPNLEDNAMEVETTYETGSDKLDNEVQAIDEDTDEGEEDDGKDQSSEDSRDERHSEESTNSDGSVESSYLDDEDTGLADL
ncbi:hypothetical protein DFS33DRAFT_1387841 [Desarmillaria ectypa]|nr:hypothetical protein DFS33DRAFT_1387841 [Desarmillaria ectypa]